MGLSKSKTKTTTDNTPWGPAQPYILKGMQQTGRVFDAQQPELEQFAKMQRDSYGRLAPGAEEGIQGSQDLVNRNLRGDNLMGNPYLEQMLAASRANAINATNSQFESSGRYGSGQHAGILAGAIANAENAARFQNYGVERGYQQAAIGDAQQLMGGSQSLLNNAAEIPWIGVGALNGNIRQASNGYGKQVSTQVASPNWGQLLMQSAANAASAFAGQSDRRLKENIERVGELDSGITVYEYDFKTDTGLDLPEGRQRGVMADEVLALRPDAYIENFNNTGYAGVDYGKLETAK